MKPARWAVLAAIPFLAALLPGCAHHYYRHSTWMLPPRLHISDYRFEVSLLADTVIPYQNFWLRVAVENLTAETLPAPDTYSEGNLFSVKFIDEWGNELRTAWVCELTASSAFGTLSPRETLVRYKEMGWKMWEPPRPLDTSFVGKRLRMIIVLHRGAFSDSVIQDTTMFKPRVFSLTSVPAKGDELEATRLYLQANLDGEERNFGAADDSLHALLSRYPRSRLVESAIYKLHRILGSESGRSLNPTTGAVALIEDLIRRRPDSPLLIYFIRTLDLSPGYSKELHNALVREIASRKPDAAALEELKIIP